MGVGELPDMDSLLCFEAAARLLNFRAAAKSVALTPGALSQRIKQLELRLEARLFERSTRSVQLTEAGRALLPMATATLAAARECAEVVRGSRGPAPIELTIGTRFELGLSWLAECLPDLERQLPHITIHMYFGSGPELLDLLLARRLDCAITSARLTDANLDALKLHEEAYVFVGAPSLLARLPFETPEDAHAHTLFDIDASLPLTRYLTNAAGEHHTLRFGQLRWLGLGAVIRRQVLAGRGVAVLPRYMVEGDVEAGELVELLPTIRPHRDFFRLVFRTDASVRTTFHQLAQALRTLPIQ